VMPHDPSMRPAWMIRIGLFLYDHLARREVLPGSRMVNLRRHPAGAPLKPSFTKGFVYSDGWVDDARLVVLNAVDAAARGATVLTRTCCVDAKRSATHWQLRLESDQGHVHEVHARVLVNAAGPWAAEFLGAGNVLTGEAHRGVAHTPLGAVATNGAAGAVALLVRPELVGLAPDPDGDGEVVSREFRGHDVFYRVRVNGLELVSQRPSNEVVPLGSRVEVTLHDGQVAILS